MRTKLSYAEILNTCCLLGVLVERLVESLRVTQATVEFLTVEILGVKADFYTANKKTPWKKFEELEVMVKGMNAYYQEKLAEMQHKPTPKRNIITN